MRFFMQWQDFKVGFSNVSAICINQACNQKFFGKFFVELGYFNKHIVKNTRKKRTAGKKFGVFSPIYF